MWGTFAGTLSEQLPCRSAEEKFLSIFLCQRCREIWREILEKFSVLRFPGFGCARENFTKISRQKRCEKNGKFHANFTLLGRSAETLVKVMGVLVNRTSRVHQSSPEFAKLRHVVRMKVRACFWYTLELA